MLFFFFLSPANVLIGNLHHHSAYVEFYTLVLSQEVKNLLMI